MSQIQFTEIFMHIKMFTVLKTKIVAFKDLAYWCVKFAKRTNEVEHICSLCSVLYTLENAKRSKGQKKEDPKLTLNYKTNRLQPSWGGGDNFRQAHDRQDEGIGHPSSLPLPLVLPAWYFWDGTGILLSHLDMEWGKVTWSRSPTYLICGG